MPQPLSATSNTALSPARETESISSVMPFAWNTAFSRRFSSTCSMRSESMGISTNSSGICVMTFWFGCFLENFMRTESISSSRTVGVFTTLTFAPSILVTDRRFSTMRMSHSLSSWISPSSLSCCSFGSSSYLESSVEDDPYMEVRGVRRSWEIARSRLPRILSFSFSERSFS